MTAICWAFERVANPTVLRLHVTAELTTETIVTYPPDRPPTPLDRLLALEGVRSLDLHRYRCRLNLEPSGGRAEIARLAGAVLGEAWGEESPLLIEELPRAFEVRHVGLRKVAESPAMASGDPVASALFGVAGVSEAVVGNGLALVRLGRLFRWEDVEPRVRQALRDYQER